MNYTKRFFASSSTFVRLMLKMRIYGLLRIFQFEQKGIDGLEINVGGILKGYFYGIEGFKMKEFTFVEELKFKNS